MFNAIMKRISLIFCLLAVALLGSAQAKYVFYFIGDGMGTNQVLGTEMYLSEYPAMYKSLHELGMEIGVFSLGFVLPLVAVMLYLVLCACSPCNAFALAVLQLDTVLALTAENFPEAANSPSRKYSFTALRLSKLPPPVSISL